MRLSWVDDCIVCGKEEGVVKAKSEMIERFDCGDIGELNKYVVCKIDSDEGSIKLTQPVTIQSFEDEFDITNEQYSNTPAIPGSVLSGGEEKDWMAQTKQTTYRQGVGK
jgi:hypothetical protein